MKNAPFFARFLESQRSLDQKNASQLTGGGPISETSKMSDAVTEKYPSDDDEVFTEKYPSDDDEPFTEKYPSDNEEG